MSITYQGIPPISTPFVNPDGTVNLTWYRFLNSLCIKSGLGPTNISTVNRIGVVHSSNRVASGGELIRSGPNVSVAYNIQSGGSTAYICIYDNMTGEFIGTINFTSLIAPIVNTPPT